MNELDIKIIREFLGIFNKARFDVSAVEMIQMTKKFDAVGRLIVRHEQLLKPKIISNIPGPEQKSKSKGKRGKSRRHK